VAGFSFLATLVYQIRRAYILPVVCSLKSSSGNLQNEFFVFEILSENFVKDNYLDNATFKDFDRMNQIYKIKIDKSSEKNPI
jgi:hypothetical protein